MSHMTKQDCECAYLFPEKPCSYSDWRILWVPTGPELHNVKMAPYTYVGRYACSGHENLYWTDLRRRLQAANIDAPKKKVSQEPAPDTLSLF